MNNGDTITVSKLGENGIPDSVVSVEDIDEDRWYRTPQDPTMWYMPIDQGYSLNIVDLARRYGPLTIVETASTS